MCTQRTPKRANSELRLTASFLVFFQADKRRQNYKRLNKQIEYNSTFVLFICFVFFIPPFRSRFIPSTGETESTALSKC
jgi:hypothetical protein